MGISFARYIGIAIWARTGLTKEFYVAGGGVPPFAILYTTAPAVAAFARVNRINTIGATAGSGTLYSEVPSWISNWETTGLIAWEDKNNDGCMFYANDDRNERKIDRDIMVLVISTSILHDLLKRNLMPCIIGPWMWPVRTVS